MQIVGSLMAEDLVTLKRVAQDGMRVRANAGKSSFHRRKHLEQCLEEARRQVEELKRLTEELPEELSHRQRAARERAAAERQRRVEEALRQCGELQQQREATARKSGRPAVEVRASTAEPEARNMKFADGGCRPGHNVQFATDIDSGAIVGVDDSNEGVDQGQLPPMLDQLHARYQQTPEVATVDGGVASLETVEQAAARQCLVYAPLKEEEKQLAAGKALYAPKRGDSAAIAAWRVRMGTAAGKAIYQL